MIGRIVARDLFFLSLSLSLSLSLFSFPFLSMRTEKRQAAGGVLGTLDAVGVHRQREDRTLIDAGGVRRAAKLTVEADALDPLGGGRPRVRARARSRRQHGVAGTAAVKGQVHVQVGAEVVDDFDVLRGRCRHGGWRFVLGCRPSCDAGDPEDDTNRLPAAGRAGPFGTHVPVIKKEEREGAPFCACGSGAVPCPDASFLHLFPSCLFPIFFFQKGQKDLCGVLFFCALGRWPFFVTC
nr:hypothetical protein [Pandoravirus belohorizontensis]